MTDNQRPHQTEFLEKIAKLSYVVIRQFRLDFMREMTSIWECIPTVERVDMIEWVEKILRGDFAKVEDFHVAKSNALLQKGWTWGSKRHLGKKLDPLLKPWEKLPPMLQRELSIYFQNICLWKQWREGA